MSGRPINALELYGRIKSERDKTSQTLKERGIPGQEFNPNGGLAAYVSPYAIADVPAEAVDRPFWVDMWGSQGTPLSRGADWARQNGYAGIAQDGYQTNIFDPRNIRSVNAAFDPAKSDSANLLAANAKSGAAVISAGMEASQDQSTDPGLIDYLRSVGLM